MDAGDGEATAPVESRHGREHERPDRGEQDGGIEWLRRWIVGPLGRGTPEGERQFPGLSSSGHDVHRGTLVDRHLGREVCGTAESVDTKAPAGRAGVRAAKPGSR